MVADQRRESAAVKEMTRVKGALFEASSNRLEPNCVMCWVGGLGLMRHYRKDCTAGNTLGSEEKWAPRVEWDAAELGARFDDPVADGLMCWRCWFP